MFDDQYRFKILHGLRNINRNVNEIFREGLTFLSRLLGTQCWAKMVSGDNSEDPGSGQHQDRKLPSPSLSLSPRNSFHSLHNWENILSRADLGRCYATYLDITLKTEHLSDTRKHRRHWHDVTQTWHGTAPLSQVHNILIFPDAD